MLLSICIPTYNRADLLGYCLENLRELDQHDIEYEIIVVDHASPDHTPEVVKEAAKKNPRIRSYRQHHQLDIIQQYIATMRMAKGMVSVYVADDDKVDAAQLVAYAKMLESSPEVSAIYAPWLAYDDVEEKVLHGYFEVKERTVFTAEKPLDYLNFFSRNNIWPEVGIYRTETLQSFLSAHVNSPYIAFLMAYSLLRRGNVVFETKPFYYEVARVKPEYKMTPRLNTEWSVENMDQIRGGIEMMLSRMMMDYGQQKVPDEMRHTLHEMLINYTHNRLIFKFRQALERRKFLAACECAQRVMVWRGFFQPDLVDLSHQIYGFAAVESAANVFRGSSWLTHLYLTGFNQPEQIEKLLAEFLQGDVEDKKRKFELVSAAPDKNLKAKDVENAMVLVKYEKERAPYIEQGFLPGNVVALEQLAQYSQLLPAQRQIEDM